MAVEEKKALLSEVEEGKEASNLRQNYGCVNEEFAANHEIETFQDYKARWRSIHTLYLTMFFSSVEFAIVMSSLWPYLKKMDPNVSTTFLGWTNSGFSLCQMAGSFLLGLWCHYLPAIQPLMCSLIFMSAGSLLYGYGYSFNKNGLEVILSARLLLGLSAGNVAVCRAVLSQTTTLKERTKAFAHLAMWQATGFAFGPAMQVATIPIGDKGIHIDSLKMNLNAYTAPGFLGFIMTLVNIIAVLTWFREFEIDIYEGKRPPEVQTGTIHKPDHRAIFVTSVLFFVLLTVFALNETILTPLVMIEFGWSNIDTVFYGGIILAIAGVVAILCFRVVEWLSSMFSEATIVAGGLLTILLGFIVYLPWGNEYPTPQLSRIVRHGNTTVTELTNGCPIKFKWCKTQPKLYFPQFLAAATLVGVGYPIGFLAVSTLYSKLLGPRQQGGYMALISAIGSFARVIGPLLVTSGFVNLGPRWTFFAVDVLLTFTILLIGCNFDLLVPFHQYIKRISHIRV